MGDLIGLNVELPGERLTSVCLPAHDVGQRFSPRLRLVELRCHLGRRLAKRAQLGPQSLSLGLLPANLDPERVPFCLRFAEPFLQAGLI